MNAKPPVRPRGSTERVLRSMYASEAPPEVDDDAGVRQSLRLYLEAAGARVLAMATGGAALEALDRGHFDVVFLDLWLGAEAGLDGAGLRQESPNAGWRRARRP
jgi:PleD family two-component response regulator